MGTDSGIEYVNHTLNFWKGCTKVSVGCDNCYMYRDAKRYGWDPTKITRCGELLWRQPQHRERQGDLRWAKGDRVFVCSWSDFFHEDADRWREDAWRVVRGRPDLIWIFTTKRIERVAEGRVILKCLPHDFSKEDYPNVMFMPTCENQEMADKRIPPALELKATYPWVKIGVSLEPLLGAIDLTCIRPHPPVVINALAGRWFDMHIAFNEEKLDQVIVGGESGPGARPCDINWIYNIVHQCGLANVPVFVKQIHLWKLNWNNELYESEKELRSHYGQECNPKRVLIKDVNQFPEDLRVRELV